MYNWYAIRVRTRYEKVVSQVLRGKGFEEFPALYRTRHRWADRYKEIELPLFPGYVFCRFDPHCQMPVLSSPGVTSIVGFDGTPARVEDAEITAVQAVIHSGLPAQPWPFLKAGQPVRVVCGSLADVEGIVVSLKSGWRLIISVTLLQRSVSVEISRDQVEPIAPSCERMLGHAGIC